MENPSQRGDQRESNSPLPNVDLFHNRYKTQARLYLEKCRRIQSALDQGMLIQLDWAGPALERDGWQRRVLGAAR